MDVTLNISRCGHSRILALASAALLSAASLAAASGAQSLIEACRVPAGRRSPRGPRPRT